MADGMDFSQDTHLLLDLSFCRAVGHTLILEASVLGVAGVTVPLYEL